MKFSINTLSWGSRAWQPPSEKTLAERNIWWAATHDVDGGVEAALREWAKNIDEDERASLVNTYKNLEEEDIKRIQPDMKDDINIGVGYSLLSIAIYRNLINDIKFLLQQPSILLNRPSGSELLTPLHISIIRENYDIVFEILRNRSTAPSQLVNAYDYHGRTALHHAVMKWTKNGKEAEDTSEMSRSHRIVLQLLTYGANIDAQNRSFHTPLHLLVIHGSDQEATRFAEILLENGAEVNTKDEFGDSPLHSACRRGHHALIRLLIDWGADMDCRNLDWTTPQDLFLSRDEMTEDDRAFAQDIFSRLKKPNMTRARAGNIPRGPTECIDEMRNICAEFPVYFRYQWAGLNPKPDGNTSMAWIRSDMKVSHVLYPKPEEHEETLEPVNGGDGFLASCEDKFKSKAWLSWKEENKNNSSTQQRATRQENGKDESESEETRSQKPEDHRKRVEEDVRRNSWRWINFPSNNMTWIKDFIILNAKNKESGQLDERAWRFFEENIRIHETDSLYSRVRIPHAKVSHKSDRINTSLQNKKENPKTKINYSVVKQDIQSAPGSNGTNVNVALSTVADISLTTTMNTEKVQDQKEVEPSTFQSWKNTDGFMPGKMLSLVVPFLDIETEDQVQSGFENLETQCQRVKKLNEVYSPFTGMHGVQHSQTLDQIYYNTESDVTQLHSVKEQVIYRWSARRNKEREQSQDHQDQSSHQLTQAAAKEHDSVSTSPEVSNQNIQLMPQQKWLGFIQKLKQKLWHPRQPQQPQKLTPSRILHPRQQDADPIKQRRPGGKDAKNANAKRIREDPSPKWLMSRQLWLWKLDDNTIITAIPSRANGMTADTLLETIRQGNLDVLTTPNDLIKRILHETVSFLDEFKWAGLGIHILDIFEGEIATETNREAEFFKTFSSGNWSPDNVNRFIQEAADCTYRVRDIRDELHLLRQVFETQAKVVSDFAAVFWPTGAPGSQKQGNVASRDMREGFIRDCGLQSLVQRVRRMEGDASTTLEGLSTIIQAMQAQASLKEAEQSRFLNLMILPFTIITVIFTPLSFLTSLFAVNTLAFPHNDDGELRLPASWFSWRMVVGEISSLLPLGLLVLLIYFWYGSESDNVSSQRIAPERLSRRKVVGRERRPRAEA
ncbi:uncharacterized protein F4812DRAFT_261902 [Daldinia caldariorum]|uniref:uncharacterized protein n=1 Tax=Daldinia caldariorum TaxID=326644 RepID=UPI002008EA97|nr:uncharacterized protein F4812DRAFT_261902 [Daldinia caldariorum]KAI1470342.1 hypothetical protein F4812DRAFT_261902 [Daldinia caldariorum]